MGAMKAIQSLLVIKVRALGDTLLATPSLRALRRGLPEARITAVVAPAGREILEDNPDVDEILVYDKAMDGWGGWLRFVAGLRRKKYDAAVSLHASFRTALLALASGARIRIVHNHSGRNFFSTLRITAKKESKSAIARDLDAVRALGLADSGDGLTLPLRPRHHESAAAYLREHGLASSKRLYLLAPGAGKERKRWTPEAAAAFLDQVTDRLDSDWVLLAGPAEQGMADAIRQLAKNKPRIFARGIKEAAALMACCQGVVTADSGPKHVAVAMGTPTLTLWTDEPEAEWHPYDHGRHALLRSRTGIVADIAAGEAVQAAVDHFGRMPAKETKESQ